MSNYVEGDKDIKYGGIVTNVSKLPVGTKFYVNNGAWYGEIGEDDSSRYIKIEGHGKRRYNENSTILLSLSEIEYPKEGE